MEVTIRRPDDFHVHFRRGRILRTVVPYTASWFKRALVMPNTDPPILSAKSAEKYQQEIASAARNRDFQPLMTIKIVQSTRPEWIPAARRAGVIAGKGYPTGVTTNAADGIRNFFSLRDVFAAMEEENMPLSLHGEQPGVFCLDREKAFLTTLEWLSRNFPRLRIVLEHITTRAAVSRVRALPDKVAATITAHHLVLTLDDVIGEKLRPHNFCLPVAKSPEDREAIRQAAVSGDPKFFFGSDSAPHPVADKERADGNPGLFTAPLTLPLLAQVFEEEGKLDRLKNFTSVFGALFYDLPANEGSLTLANEPAAVPYTIPYGTSYSSGFREAIVPFMAGKVLSWSVKDSNYLSARIPLSP